MKPFPPVAAEGRGHVRVMKKFDAEVATTIVKYLRSGAFIETAAAAAGISKVTLYEWLRRGRRQGKGPMFDFVQLTEQAMGESEMMAILQISKAASTQWQAAAWHLERKYPERWGRRDRLEMSGTTDVSKEWRGAARTKLEELDGDKPDDDPESSDEGA
jgi:hypothetical protein